MNIINKNITKPLSTNFTILLNNMLFLKALKLFEIFMNFFISFYLIKELFFDFIDSSNKIIKIKFLISFINTLFLIMNTTLNINLMFSLKNISFVITSIFTITIKETRKLRWCKITLEMSPIRKLNMSWPNITSNS